MVLEIITVLVVSHCKPMYQPEVCSKTIMTCIFKKAKKMSKTQTELSNKDANEIAGCIEVYKNVKVLIIPKV